MSQEKIQWEGSTFIVVGLETDPIRNCAGCENPAEGGSRMIEVGAEIPSFVWCEDCLATARAGAVSRG